MNSSAPISRLVSPSASSARTSTSRGVRSACSSPACPTGPWLAELDARAATERLEFGAKRPRAQLDGHLVRRPQERLDLAPFSRSPRAAPRPGATVRRRRHSRCPARPIARRPRPTEPRHRARRSAISRPRRPRDRPRPVAAVAALLLLDQRVEAFEQLARFRPAPQQRAPISGRGRREVRVRAHPVLVEPRGVEHVLIACDSLEAASRSPRAPLAAARATARAMRARRTAGRATSRPVSRRICSSAWSSAGRGFVELTALDLKLPEVSVDHRRIEPRRTAIDHIA